MVGVQGWVGVRVGKIGSKKPPNKLTAVIWNQEESYQKPVQLSRELYCIANKTMNEPGLKKKKLFTVQNENRLQFLQRSKQSSEALEPARRGGQWE